MKIQVLGSGCATCHKLHEIVKQIAHEIAGKNQVEYLTGEKGMQKIIELGVMNSPVLVVDGKIAMTGFVPDIKKIKEKILAASDNK